MLHKHARLRLGNTLEADSTSSAVVRSRKNYFLGAEVCTSFIFITFYCHFFLSTSGIDDPCSSNPCDTNAICDSTGGVSCACTEGYTGDGYTCTGNMVYNVSFSNHNVIGIMM